MKSHTLNLLRAIGNYAVGAGVVASAIGTAAVVNAASRSSDFSDETVNPKHSCTHIPTNDYPPFRKWNFNWDRLEPGQDGSIWPTTNFVSNSKTSEEAFNYFKGELTTCEEDDKYPKCRRNLILIRHGQYSQAGDDDFVHRLTPLGEEQAAITGKKLATMGIKFTSITSSGLTRAIQTANIILENMDCANRCLKLGKDPLLNEGTPCVPEPPYRNKDIWNPPPREVLVEGPRVETGFRKYFHRAEKSQQEDSWEIIVCHANVIRYFTVRALQFSPEGWLRISLDHCSLTRLTILPTGEVILRGLGDSGHIPDKKNTALNA